MQNRKGLSQIAEIITGYTFRAPIREGVENGLSVLQAKNIKDDVLNDESEFVKASLDTSHTRAFAQDGDVVIGARGIFKACVVRSKSKILAASSVYLLRIKNENLVFPEYLSIYLNSVTGQRNLSQFLTAGTIRSLLKKDLEIINIPVPSVEKQKQIIELARSVRLQAQLLNRKLAIQKNIVNSILNQLERS